MAADKVMSTGETCPAQSNLLTFKEAVLSFSSGKNPDDLATSSGAAGEVVVFLLARTTIWRALFFGPNRRRRHQTWIAF
jgi:hypothetical protein